MAWTLPAPPRRAPPDSVLPCSSHSSPRGKLARSPSWGRSRPRPDAWLTRCASLTGRTGDGHPRSGPAFHGHAELDYAQGLLYTEIGHHGAATKFLRAALAHQDRAYGRNRALYRLTLSGGLIAAGEADEGAAYAVQSLEHLDEVESGRVMRRLAEVAGLLSDVDAASAQEASDELTEYAHAKGAA